MNFAERYLKNNIYKDIIISGAPSGLLKYIVIIPAYSETDIFNTLESILACHPSSFHVEIIIHVNYPEGAPLEIKEQNISIYNKLTCWSESNSSSALKFIPIISKNLPAKYAGAGLARKIAMDLAVARYSLINKPNGFILSLDADTLVPTNYFTSLDSLLIEHTRINCVIFNFCHPTKGDKYGKKIYTAAALYETHLRYYKLALKKAGFPFYNYTIGSCFGVTAFNYIKHGGMSKRKAGEDFYFLQKIFPNSHIKFLSDVVLTPSPRPSWRVPFGTGPSIKEIANHFKPQFKTYHPELFRQLSRLFISIPEYYQQTPIHIEKSLKKLPDNLQNYLRGLGFNKHILDINKNVASVNSFNKRFYSWFDAFQVIKFLNYSSANSFPNILIQEALINLFPEFFNNEQSIIEVLIKIRSLDSPS